MISAQFLMTSFIVVLMPGTGVIYTVSNGLFLGKRAGMAAACGCTAGIIPHLAASVLGLSAILHTSALMFQAIKYAGALYLLYLAWAMWHDTGMIRIKSPSQANSLGRIAARGILINILNPKLSIFFLAFLPHFISPEAGPALFQFMVLSLLFMAMTLIVFILYGLAANGVSRYIANSPRVLVRIQRSFALTFAALGIRLAATRQ